VTIQGEQHCARSRLPSPAIFLPRRSFSVLPRFSGDRTWLSITAAQSTRSAILDVLSQLGLEIRFLHVTERNGEVVGSIQARGGKLRGAVVRGATSALLIDELPVLAAIAP